MNIKKIVVGSTLLAMAGAAFGAQDTSPPLVSPAWVAAHTCKPGIVVVDVRSPVGGGGDKFTYMSGHVPCAVYSNYAKAGWRIKEKDIPGMLPPVAQLDKLIGGLGIDNHTHVVIYSAGTNALDMGSATRVFWTFKVLGDKNVSIMDGGYKAYVAGKYPIKRGMQTASAAQFSGHLDHNLLASESEVEQAMKSGNKIQLVDNRPMSQYLGVTKPPMDKRAGTIPGAANLPQGWFTVNDGGEFRSIAQLKALYKQAGVGTQGEQINFCNTGHWASLGWFVSYELLHNKQAKVYDGSMAQWSSNPALPMETKIKLTQAN
ncbi:sulfurtransferase [Acidihalobacter yilgarnensis]|uniref:Sulfurtransferase n=1 Tax=Acidihalobacter yilgarnensis TaxID=2819280 RepID=A0A1D8IMJ5_9GAMM|nr:sulfurtransferase [Acidihalobacter yilgarnensis]AOU97644.1 sulfurtransferase [Acidihalobacter yilgarnensis]